MSLWEKWDLISINIYLYIYLFEGVIIYYLGDYIYIREIILLLILISYYKNIIKNGKMGKYDIYWISILLFYFLVGLFFIENIKQVILGSKLFILIYIGYILYKKYFNNINFLKKYYMGFFLLSCLGIFLQYFYNDLPWSSVQRTWTIYTAGISDSTDNLFRLAGFGRLSNSVASMIVCSFVWIICFCNRKWIYSIIGLIAVILTTSRGGIVAYIICMCIYFFKGHKGEKFLLKTFFYVSIISLIGLPIYAIVFDGGNDVYLKDDVFVFLLATIQDRMVNSWNGTFLIVKNYGSMLLGRGFGGIGSVRELYDKFVSYQNPIDNFFVMLYGNIGILVFIIFFVIIKKIIKLDFSKIEEKYIYIFFIMLFYAGIVNDMMEPMILIHLGYCMGYLLYNIK